MGTCHVQNSRTTFIMTNSLSGIEIQQENGLKNIVAFTCNDKVNPISQAFQCVSKSDEHESEFQFHTIFQIREIESNTVLRK